MISSACSVTITNTLSPVQTSKPINCCLDVAAVLCVRDLSHSLPPLPAPSCAARACPRPRIEALKQRCAWSIPHASALGASYCLPQHNITNPHLSPTTDFTTAAPDPTRRLAQPADRSQHHTRTPSCRRAGRRPFRV